MLQFFLFFLWLQVVNICQIKWMRKELLYGANGLFRKLKLLGLELFTVPVGPPHYYYTSSNCNNLNPGLGFCCLGKTRLGCCFKRTLIDVAIYEIRVFVWYRMRHLLISEKVISCSVKKLYVLRWWCLGQLLHGQGPMRARSWANNNLA